MTGLSVFRALDMRRKQWRDHSLVDRWSTFYESKIKDQFRKKTCRQQLPPEDMELPVVREYIVLLDTSITSVPKPFMYGIVVEKKGSSFIGIESK